MPTEHTSSKPSDAPGWKKDLRLLRRKGAKKRQAGPSSKTNGRVQTPVQRYGNESFENGLEKFSTPHFNTVSYSTPPRTRSPRVNLQQSDEGIFKDLSDSIINRSFENRQGDRGNKQVGLAYNERAGYDSDVEIGSGGNETNEAVQFSDIDEAHPFKVAVSPLPVKASVDASAPLDANSSLVDDTRGIMDDGELWSRDDYGGGPKHSSEKAVSESKQKNGMFPEVARVKMTANGPTPSSKAPMSKARLDEVSTGKAPTDNSKAGGEKKSFMRRMLGSLTNRKKSSKQTSLPEISKPHRSEKLPKGKETGIIDHHRKSAQSEPEETTKLETIEAGDDVERVPICEGVEAKEDCVSRKVESIDFAAKEPSEGVKQSEEDTSFDFAAEDADSFGDKPMWRSDMADSSGSDSDQDDAVEEKHSTESVEGKKMSELEFRPRESAAKSNGFDDLGPKEDEWKIARSADGQVYFYHRKSRKTQWTVPEDGRIVNASDFPEIRVRAQRHAEANSFVQDIDDDAQLEAASSADINVKKIKEKSADNIEMDPARKLHFGSRSVNDIEDGVELHDAFNKLSRDYAEDPRMKISPSAAIAGRMFAIKQAAVVLLSASPRSVAELHCPYCSAKGPREHFVNHLQTCPSLTSYLCTSPSRMNPTISFDNIEASDQMGLNALKWEQSNYDDNADSRKHLAQGGGFRTPVKKFLNDDEFSFENDYAEVESLKSNGSPSDVKLYPCEHCDRTFAYSRLAVHQRVCQKIFGEKRVPYDAGRARLKGTPFRHHNPASHSVSQPPKIRRSSRNEMKEDYTGDDTFDSPARSSKMLTPNVEKYEKRPATTGSKIEKVKCPFCKVVTRKKDLSSHFLKCKRQKESRNVVWGAAKDRQEHQFWSASRPRTRSRHYLAQTPSVSELPAV